MSQVSRSANDAVDSSLTESADRCAKISARLDEEIRKARSGGDDVASRSERRGAARRQFYWRYEGAGWNSARRPRLIKLNDDEEKKLENG